jgi:anti-anti-sigma factor
MKEDELDITQEIKDGICRIYAKGRIDSNTANTLQLTLESAIDKGQKIIILNMLQVMYLSSIGIRVILKIFKQAGEMGGSFKIERPSEIVKNVLGMVALEEMLITK